MKLLRFLLLACLVSACSTVQEKDPILMAADKAFYEADYETAINLYQQASQMYPKDLGISFKLGESYFASGNLDKAKQYFENASSDRRYGVCAKKQMGRILLTQGEKQKALTIFQGLPEDRDVLNGMGVCCDQLGNHRQAQEYYLKNINNDPSDVQSKSNLGLSKLFDKSYSDALALLEPIGSAVEATKQQRHNLALAYALSNSSEKCHEILNGEVDLEQVERFVQQLQSMSSLEGESSVS